MESLLPKHIHDDHSDYYLSMFGNITSGAHGDVERPATCQ